MEVTAASPRLRARLLPHSGWARAALLLLILFALLRSVLWASVQPGWLAPDEDYHWLYINYMVEKHTVPNLSKPFYTDELFRSVALVKQGLFLAGADGSYSGDPHAVLSKLGGPLSEREPAPPNPRQVLHPPGYYLGGFVIDEILWHKVSITRLTAIRYYSALLGAITIFFAWLLAAAVLAREWQQLAAAALASLQPILAFSASTITNDVGVAVALTATLAWCAWMLRGPPTARPGRSRNSVLDRGDGEGDDALARDRDRRRTRVPMARVSRCPAAALGRSEMDDRDPRRARRLVVRAPGHRDRVDTR